MSAYHNNQLNMVNLFDPDDNFDFIGQPPAMPWPAENNFAGAINADEGLFNDHEPAPQVNYGFASHDLFQPPDHFITDSSGSQEQKPDDDFEAQSENGFLDTSYDSPHDSDYVETARDDRRPPKMSKVSKTKINKDGEPRKPRQPRPKLVKWSDNDWKNVLLGIVWACGEAGVQIPFEQAAQTVGESCTAGALQQALLKLRSKQVADGFRIPALKMSWSRKNRGRRASSPIANGKSMQAQSSINTRARKSTRQKGNDSLVVTLKTSYRGAGTMLLETKKTSAKKRRTITSDSPERTPTRRPTLQDQLQTAQQPQQTITKIEEPAIPIPRNPEGQAQLVHNGGEQAPNFHNVNMATFPEVVNQLPNSVQERKLYNRNHAVVDDFLIDGNNNVMGTPDELRSFEGIVTPQNNSLNHGYFNNTPNQVAPTYGTQYGMNGGHDPQFTSDNLQQTGFFNYPNTTGYEAFTPSDNNQGLFDDAFLNDPNNFQPFDTTFF